VAYYLGIDVGTSGTKALLMDAHAKVLASAIAPHGVSSPRPGWSEQSPRQWWSATIQAVRAVLAEAGIDGRGVAGIGLSGQMHGLVITDSAGRPLRSAIIWNDQRTSQEAVRIERKAGGRRRLIALVGNVAMTSFTLTKLLWVRRHQPALYDRIGHLLLPKDYVRLCLTGEYVGDVSDSSGTLMLDPRKRDWSGKVLSLFGIDRSILPPVVESQAISGRLRPAAVSELGLLAGTPVVGGAGDQPAGAVGNGVVIDGLTSATVGTSGVVYVHSKDFRTDPAGRVQTFCSAVPGEYCMFGCVLAAGGSLQWFRDVLGQAEVERAASAGGSPYTLLDDLARQAPAGCEGLFFLPYLTGERTPHADPFARACWIGIQSRTTRAGLVRSVVEGATFAMNDAMNVLGGMGVRIHQVRLSGGGARSAFWRQLQADVYGRTCVTINAEEGPAYGAALLAAVGTGGFSSVREACREGIRITRTIRPRAEAARRYARLYAQYRRLYPALREEFARIGKLP